MRALRILARVWRPLALLGALVGLGAAIYSDREGIAAYPWRLSWPVFACAVLLFSCGPFMGALVFRILLHDLTGQTPIGAATRVWMRGFLARYVPSGALTMAVRLQAREQLHATAGQVWRATLVEQLVSVIGGAAAATTAFVFAGDHVPLPAPLLLGGGLLVAVVVTRRLAVAFASLAACCSWITTGAAVWLIVAAMTPSATGAFFLIGAYAFAWALGFVVVFAPSGLGVREAVLIGLLGPRLGTGPATLVAVTLRLANTAGDVLAFAIVEAVGARAILFRRLQPRRRRHGEVAAHSCEREPELADAGARGAG